MEVLNLMRRQYGAISRTQAAENGLSPGQIRQQLATGRWLRVFPGVYRNAGAPATMHTHWQSVLLRLGGAAWLSNSSAARLQQLDPRAQLLPIHVTVPY